MFRQNLGVFLLLMICVFISAIIYGLFGFIQPLVFSVASILLLVFMIVFVKCMICLAKFIDYLEDLVLKRFEKKE